MIRRNSYLSLKLLSLILFCSCFVVQAQNRSAVGKVDSYLSIGGGLIYRDFGPSEMFHYGFFATPSASLEYQGVINTSSWGIGFGVELGYFNYKYEFDTREVIDSFGTVAGSIGNYDHKILRIQIPVLAVIPLNKWRITVGPVLDHLIFGKYDAVTGSQYGAESWVNYYFKGWKLNLNPFDKTWMHKPYHLRFGTAFNFHERWSARLNINVFPTHTIEGFLKLAWKIN